MEFPEFSHRQFERLQELHQARKAIYQIEPYLERIIEIHTLLAQGAPPQEVADQPHLRPIYETEKQADGLLLKYRSFPEGGDRSQRICSGRCGSLPFAG